MNKTDSTSFIGRYLEGSSNALSSVSNLSKELSRTVEDLAQAVNAGGRVYACGNGGSACDAMHLTEELVARYLRERPGIAAHHLMDSGTMSCWANDYDFDTVYSRQVETLVTENDFLFAFSTSGNSSNIVNAAQAAKKKNAKVVALSGKDGGALCEFADYKLLVHSEVTSHIQESHIVMVHIICDLLEQTLFPKA